MTNEELVALIQAGERNRLPELWEQVERFVAWKASKLLIALGPDNAASAGVEFDDLYNSGYIALVDAVESYRHEGECKFTTWLAFHLKNTFAKTGGWRGKTGDRQKALDSLNRKSTRSMDAPVTGGADDGDKAAFGDFIPDPSAAQAFQNVEEQLYQEQLHAALERALDTLEADEEATIRARYYQGRTLEETGPQARKLESHALVKLRRPQVRRELEQFIEQRTPYYLRVGVQTFQNTWESAVERILFMREQMREKRCTV